MRIKPRWPIQKYLKINILNKFQDAIRNTYWIKINLRLLVSYVYDKMIMIIILMTLVCFLSVMYQILKIMLTIIYKFKVI